MIIDLDDSRPSAKLRWYSFLKINVMLLTNAVQFDAQLKTSVRKHKNCQPAEV